MIDAARDLVRAEEVSVWCSLDGESWQAASREHQTGAWDGVQAGCFQMTDASHTLIVEGWDRSLKTHLFVVKKDIVDVLEVSAQHDRHDADIVL